MAEGRVLVPDSPTVSVSSPGSLVFSSNEEIIVLSQGVTNTLRFENLAENLTANQLRGYLSVHGYCKVDKKGTSAMATFNDPDASYNAMQMNHCEILGDDVTVKYDEDVDTLDTVFIKNIDKGTSTTDLRLFLSLYGEITAINIVGDCATVQFFYANEAVECFRRFYNNKLEWKVSMTKP